MSGGPLLRDPGSFEQMTAGGAYPNDDCAEASAYKDAVALGKGQGWSVRHLEQLGIHDDDSEVNGTTTPILVDMLKTMGVPASDYSGALDGPAARGHWLIALVKSTPEGIPSASGDRLHFVTYLGDHWFRNTANGALTFDPNFAAAYCGEGAEILVDVSLTAPAPEDEAMTTADALAILTVINELAEAAHVTGNDGWRAEVAAKIGTANYNIAGLAGFKSPPAAPVAAPAPINVAALAAQLAPLVVEHLRVSAISAS